jgi:hypothetical protein
MLLAPADDRRHAAWLSVFRPAGRQQGQPAATPLPRSQPGDPRSGTDWAIEYSRRAKASCH